MADPFQIGPLTPADFRAAALAVNCPPVTSNAVLAVQLKRLGEELAAAGEGAVLVVEKRHD